MPTAVVGLASKAKEVGASTCIAELAAPAPAFTNPLPVGLSDEVEAPNAGLEEPATGLPLVLWAIRAPGALTPELGDLPSEALFVPALVGLLAMSAFGYFKGPNRQWKNTDLRALSSIKRTEGSIKLGEWHSASSFVTSSHSKESVAKVPILTEEEDKKVGEWKCRVHRPEQTIENVGRDTDAL